MLNPLNALFSLLARLNSIARLVPYINANVGRKNRIQQAAMAEKTQSAVWLFFASTDSTSATSNLCKKTFKQNSMSKLIAHLSRAHWRQHQEYREEDDRRKAEAHDAQEVGKVYTTALHEILTYFKTHFSIGLMK